MILTNVSSFAVDSKKGDKIAQIKFLRKEEVTFEKVGEFKVLVQLIRNEFSFF